MPLAWSLALFLYLLKLSKTAQGLQHCSLHCSLMVSQGSPVIFTGNTKSLQVCDLCPGVISESDRTWSRSLSGSFQQRVGRTDASSPQDQRTLCQLLTAVQPAGLLFYFLDLPGNSPGIPDLSL